MAKRDVIPNASIASIIVELLSKDDRYEERLETLPTFSIKIKDEGDVTCIKALPSLLEAHYVCNGDLCKM